MYIQIRWCVTSCRSDVMLRWRDDDNDLYLFQEHEDERWDHYNVLGQVVGVIREESWRRPNQAGSTRQMKQYVKIPARYKSGITLFVPTSNEKAYQELKSCEELPIIHTEEIHASL